MTLVIIEINGRYLGMDLSSAMKKLAKYDGNAIAIIR